MSLLFNKIKINYTNFQKKYVTDKRRPQEYFINRYYAHIIDPFFTKVAYDLKMSPNMVTVIAGLMGIGASIAFLFDYLVIGAILLQLHHFIDGADGNLARMLNKCTPFGAKLDKYFDQIVRLFLFFSLSFVTDVSVWAKIALIATIYIDLFVIQYVVVPYMKRNKLYRARWKMWFLNRGIIPAFDIFTIYFLISIFAIFHNLESVVYIIIIGKNIDWIYRVWEVVKTKKYSKTVL
ncbi:CDP-alcohol phosphatidyltransferase family protein [Cytobacillus gottheilii]|uniref:CDP-alcohol phosphatidyltransferase family protein n=1 Tax=Cytobacillus gottheilii TaxID=859144 RepID=UPI0009EEC819|nr:CDP-alcohol phosphatidyltransferase family protein [Cytobacillus gottheilii]